MVINHLLTGVILQVTDELPWIWDFLVFYVHSRKELTARLLKNGGEGRRSGFVLGQTAYFQVPTVPTVSFREAITRLCQNVS